MAGRFKAGWGLGLGYLGVGLARLTPRHGRREEQGREAEEGWDWGGGCQPGVCGRVCGEGKSGGGGGCGG